MENTALQCRKIENESDFAVQQAVWSDLPIQPRRPASDIGGLHYSSGFLSRRSFGYRQRRDCCCSLMTASCNIALPIQVTNCPRLIGYKWKAFRTRWLWRRLRGGVQLKDGLTLPAEATLMDEPAGLWPRDPPVRFRKDIPTRWLQLTIREGKNRQIRRMTAAVGFPTLRLIRHGIGEWSLDGIAPGKWSGADI